MALKMATADNLRQALQNLEQAVGQLPAQKAPFSVRLSQGPGRGQNTFVIVVSPNTHTAVLKQLKAVPDNSVLGNMLTDAEVAQELAMPEEQRPQLTVDEANLLDEGGLKEREAGQVGALERSRIGPRKNPPAPESPT